MPFQVVKSQGMLRPGNIEPPMDSSLPARAQSTFESNSNLLNYKNLKLTSSSRDGWSNTRVRAANAEALTWREAAQRDQDEEAAAWASVPFEPEPGATTKDIRIYTKLGDVIYKYWGVQDLDETMEEFWARIDPDNTREYGEYRVTYPAIVTPASANGTSESSAGSIEIRDPETDKQIQDISHSSTEERTVETNLFGTMWPDKSRTISSVKSNVSAVSTIEPVARGRPRRNQSSVVNSSSPNPAGWSTSMKEDPPKRKRGRPAKSQDLHKPYGSDKKAKRPKAGSHVKVTKAKPKIGRPLAPSFHKMCTRARGPAENIPRF